MMLAAVLTALSLQGREAFRSELDGQYMYVYRNDRNAPEIIAYDKFTGMEFANLRDSIAGGFDTQVINTVDTVYNIPLGAIDSIAFHTQSNLYVDGVVVIEQPLSDYVYKSVDQRLYLQKSMPESLRPQKGQVLFTFGVRKRLPLGFAGRVKEISVSGDSLIYDCEEIDIDDVFERYSGYIRAPYADDADSLSVETPEVRTMATNNEYPHEPIIFEINDFVSDASISSGLNLTEFDRDILKKEQREDIEKGLREWEAGIGINNIRLEIYPKKVICDGPKFYLCKDSELFMVEMSGELEESVKIIGDISLNATLTTDIIKALTKGKSIKIANSPKKMNPIFKCLKTLSNYIFVDLNVYLGSGFIVGFETEFEQKLKYDISLGLFDLLSPYGLQRVLYKNYFENVPNFTFKPENIKCHYLFGEAKAGINIGLGIKIDIGKSEKSKSEEDKLEYRGGFSFSFNMNGMCPIGLDQNTIEDRNLLVYRGLRNNPALELDASYQFVPFSLKIGEWKFNPFETSSDLWNPFVRHNVPEFSSPVMSKDKLYSVILSDHLLYKHSVGIAVYDEESGEHEEWWYMKEDGYKNPDEWNRYEIDCSSLKPNHKYTIYPIMDQKLYWRLAIGDASSPIMANPVPMLCDIPLEVNMEAMPMTGGSKLLSDGRSALLSGSVTHFEYLSGVVAVLGFEVWKEGELSKQKVKAKYGEEFEQTLTGLALNSDYYYRAYLQIDDEKFYGETMKFRTEEVDFVDLGLSVKWCARNLGSEDETDPGYYYSWGADYSAKEFTWDSYFDNPYDASGEWQGCTKVTEDITGTQRDIASTYYGGSARMPSADEMNELITECNWEYKTVNEKPGYQVTGPNGNSIFLPCTGQYDGTELSNGDTYGGYWTGSIAETNTQSAKILYFYSSMMHSMSQSNRYIGRPIRPVCEY